jgi:hypothetical protein
VRKFCYGLASGPRCLRARRALFVAEAERKREKTELERLDVLAASVPEISEAAEILVHAHLIACGYQPAATADAK